MITLFRNPNCKRCARIVRVHHRFDWLHRIEDTTVTPPGHEPVTMGQILVQHQPSGPLLEGIAAVREIFRQVPLYWLCLPLLYLPPIAGKVDADARGCAGQCALPAEHFKSRTLGKLTARPESSYPEKIARGSHDRKSS